MPGGAGAGAPDRQFERLFNAVGRLDKAAKPILEINLRHDRIAALAHLGKDERASKTVTSRWMPRHSQNALRDYSKRGLSTLVA